MTNDKSGFSNRYEFLDALRGLAILGVLAVHCAISTRQGFPLVRFAYAGEYGVQLFFMVSAFTIFLTLERALGREKFSVQNFYTRRFFRILPMFWVGMILYSFVPGREIYQPLFSPGVSEFLLTATLQHGWHPNSINTIVPGGWTIAIEATFYLLAPLLFTFIKTWQRAMLFLIVSLFLCEIGDRGFEFLASQFQWFQTSPQKALEFFPSRWFPAQLPVFACGILTFRIWQSLPGSFFSRTNGWAFLLAAFVLLVSSVAGGSRLLLPERAFFAFGFLLLFLALAASPNILLVNSSTRFLGKISFSFYLLHFAVLELGVALSSKTFPNGLPGLVLFLLLYIVTLGMTAPIAFLTFKYIESPFIALGASWIRRRETATPEALPSGEGAAS